MWAIPCDSKKLGWKILLTRVYFWDRISSILNKNISGSQITTRSQKNNLLRPMIGPKLQNNI